MAKQAHNWTKPEITQRLKELDACIEARNFVTHSKSVEDAWAMCPKDSWMAFIIARVLPRRSCVTLFARFLRKEMKDLVPSRHFTIPMIDLAVEASRSKSIEMQEKLIRADTRLQQKWVQLPNDGSSSAESYVLNAVSSLLSMASNLEDLYEQACAASDLVEALGDALSIKFGDDLAGKRVTGLPDRVRSLMSWEVLSHKLAQAK